MILQETSSWVAQLYRYWTTLSGKNDRNNKSLFNAAAVADLTANSEQLDAVQEDAIDVPESMGVDGPHTGSKL
jgi:hypothetical protein